MKFEVGDRVVFENNKRPHKRGGTVTLIELELRYPVYVQWDDSSAECCYYENELKIKDDDPIMNVDELFKDIEL